MTGKKILVAGDVLGQFHIFYNRLKLLTESRGPFDMVLCAGSFFSLEGDDNQDPNLIYIAKEFNLKLPIYVLGPMIESQKKYFKPLFDKNLLEQPKFEDGYDIAQNVTYLGKRGLLETVDGVKVVFLSGNESQTSTDFSFDLPEVDKLIDKCSTAGRIDVLLTSSFPYHVNENSLGGKSNYLNRMNDNGSMLVAKLAKSILPRYHFSASQQEYYEREPYRNHIILHEQPKHVTRFISIAKVQKETKPRWMYAFSLVPAKSMPRDELIQQPDDVTESPYVNIDYDNLGAVKKEKNAFNNGSFFFGQTTGSSGNQRMNQKNSQSFRSNRDSSNQNENNSNKRSINQDTYEKRPKLDDSNCWFCLANPIVEKHLIISIGDYSYLTLAKGGLVERHLLIVPIGHYRSIVDLETNSELTAVIDEIGKFKNAVIDYFNSKDQIAVFFERNFKNGHLQLQIVPVPRDKARNILPTLEECSVSRQFVLRELTRGSTLASSLSTEKVPYFYIEFQGKRFFIGIKANKGFPMQFGRELMAQPTLLDCFEKIDWHNCELDFESGKKLAEKIRGEFKNYDFTL